MDENHTPPQTPTPAPAYPENHLEPNEVSAPTPEYAPQTEAPYTASAPDEPTETEYPDDSYDPDQDPTDQDQADPDAENSEQDPEEYEEDDEEVEAGEPFVTWQAEEYATGEKSPIWYVGFFAVALGLIALDLFVLRSYTFIAVIVVAVIALFLYFKTARSLTYTLDAAGLHIDERLYRYSEFRSFGILDDGKRFSIVLVPKKRFAHTVSMFFPEDLGETIVDVFGQRIPMEEIKLDLIDRLIKKLRI